MTVHAPVKIEDAIKAAKDKSPRKRYRVGLKAGTPFFSLTVGGICFPRTTKVYADEKDQVGVEERGMVVYLTDEELARAREAASYKAIRRIKNAKGELIRAITVDTRTGANKENGYASTYSPDPNDEPIAQFLTFEEEVEPSKTPVRTLADIEPPKPAELQAENAAKSRPDDAQVRARHARAKRDGSPVSGEDLDV